MYLYNTPTQNSHKIVDAILTISLSLKHVKVTFNSQFSIEVGLPNQK